MPTSAPIITLIAALTDTHRVIGRGNKLPWYLPEDLQRFKALTWGHPIIMGRKTWEFCLEKRVLPHRHSIIISHTLLRSVAGTKNHTPGIEQSIHEEETSFSVVRSLPEAITLAQSLVNSNPPKIFIIGGASIYAQTLNMAHRLELTLIHEDIEGDAFFPAYQHLLPQFDLVSSLHQADTTPSHTYMTYERKLT